MLVVAVPDRSKVFVGDDSTRQGELTVTVIFCVIQVDLTVSAHWVGETTVVVHCETVLVVAFEQQMLRSLSTLTLSTILSFSSSGSGYPAKKSILCML